jgi:hypothetical protein
MPVSAHLRLNVTLHDPEVTAPCGYFHVHNLKWPHDATVHLEHKMKEPGQASHEHLSNGPEHFQCAQLLKGGASCIPPVASSATTVCATPAFACGAKVLERNGAVDSVEHVIRAMSHCGCASIECNDQTHAQVIGEVAADWVSRLLGDVRIYHVRWTQSEEQFAAGCSIRGDDY